MMHALKDRPGTTELVVGLAIITLGLLFFLDNLNVIDSGRILDYWPVVLIVLGVLQLVQGGGSITSGAILTGVGTLLLLRNLHVLRFSLWPLLLIGIGFTLIRQALAARETERPLDVGSTLHGFALMAGLHRASTSQTFRGGDLVAIMGGCEVDLRQAAITSSPAVLHTLAFWGGIEVRVPETWSVVVEAMPIMGGYEDKSRPPVGGSSQVLIIRGVAIMGGVEIKN